LATSKDPGLDFFVFDFVVVVISFLTCRSVAEFMDFFSKTVVERTASGTRQSIKEQGNSSFLTLVP
jgi:hypothetical protein